MVVAFRRYTLPLPDIMGGGKPKCLNFECLPIGYFQVEFDGVRTGEGKLVLFAFINRSIY